MIAKLLHFQSKSVTFSANILTVSSFISALLGLLRNRLLGAHFGAGGNTDMYLAAFRIPDLVYGIFILGGISVAFVPLFSEYFEKNKEEAWAFVNNLLNVLFVGLAVFSGLLALAAPLLIHLVAPGFSAHQQEVTVGLMRLMFLSPILFGISSVLSGVLQYFDRFFAYALAPILYNIGIIFGIAFFSPIFGIWGAAIGVVGGALAYFLIQVPSFFHSGFSWKPLCKIKEPSLSRMWNLALPRLPGALAYHVNLIAMTAFASLLSAGSITVFGFANDIQSFPISVVGVSFAIAAFPALSKAFVRNDLQKLHSAFASAFSEIIFFALPLAASLFLLRAQVIRLAYGAGKFDWEHTKLTAAVLGIFTIGVIFQALIPLLVRTFFAMKNTTIPTFIGIVSVGLNIALAFVFIRFLFFEDAFSQAIAWLLHLQGISDIRVLALPLALLLSGIFQFAFLFFLLRAKLRQLFLRGFFSSFLKTLCATAALSAVTYAVLRVFGTLFALRTFGEVFFQTALALFFGGAAFLLCSWLLKSPELESIAHSLKNQFSDGTYR